jgi:hypothetical protein
LLWIFIYLFILAHKSLIMASQVVLGLFWLASLATAQDCTLQFDGRVPANFAPNTFDQANDVFSPDNVFGQSK